MAGAVSERVERGEDAVRSGFDVMLTDAATGTPRFFAPGPAVKVAAGLARHPVDALGLVELKPGFEATARSCLMIPTSARIFSEFKRQSRIGGRAGPGEHHPRHPGRPGTHPRAQPRPRRPAP